MSEVKSCLMADKEKQNNLNMQRELARYVVEYKAKNRKSALKAHRWKFFFAYGPLVFIIIGSVMKIIDEIVNIYIRVNVETLINSITWEEIFFWNIFSDIQIILMIIGISIAIISIVVFIIDACRNHKFSIGKKLIWSLLILFFHWIIFPFYFNEYIMYDDLEKVKEDYISVLEGRTSVKQENTFEEEK